MGGDSSLIFKAVAAVVGNPPNADAIPAEDTSRYLL